MTEYLFLIPYAGDWQQASINGKPIKTTDPQAYPGMPKILATEHMDYLSWEEHVEETAGVYLKSETVYKNRQRNG